MSLSNKQIIALLGLKEGYAGQNLGQRPNARLRLLGQSGGPTPIVRPTENRRRTPRLPAEQTRWAEQAVVRPGRDVRIVDISRSGALLETPTRLHLHVPVELCLTASDTKVRIEVTGRIRRCLVAGLGPMRFHAAMEFDRDLDTLLVSEIDDLPDVLAVPNPTRD